jgi:hypothetical protein
MSTCTDATVLSEVECTGNFTLTSELCAYLPTVAEELACKSSVSGAPFPRLWTPYPSQVVYAGESFADTPHSMLVVRACVSHYQPCIVHVFMRRGVWGGSQVFELLIGENWPSIMLNAVDGGNGVGVISENANPSAALYFILSQVWCFGQLIFYFLRWAPLCVSLCLIFL